jgi:hypothetical protein
MVIGSGDRALGRKACVPWTGRTTDLTPARDFAPKPHALGPSRQAVQHLKVTAPTPLANQKGTQGKHLTSPKLLRYGKQCVCFGD